MVVEPDIELTEVTAGGLQEPRREWSEAARRHFPAAVARLLDEGGTARRPDFDLPDDCIALRPAEPRDSARLLVVRDGALDDRIIRDLPHFLQPGDALVFNDTRVIPARLHGTKDTGGRVEILLERLLGGHEVLAQVGASKSP